VDRSPTRVDSERWIRVRETVFDLPPRLIASDATGVAAATRQSWHLPAVCFAWSCNLCTPARPARLLTTLRKHFGCQTKWNNSSKLSGRYINTRVAMTIRLIMLAEHGIRRHHHSGQGS